MQQKTVREPQPFFAQKHGDKLTFSYFHGYREKAFFFHGNDGNS